ncbi:helix-turn-helix domain-containing protein [Rhodopila globiformis]|uniref:HTH araC/xylS-type domain-containing protein n=1 Tax=Rhodopila globiformis TaxID=1071 RepID=A0A2S6N8A1_RHOGL|nr:helix-turn-helix domain-containing protein [Rhodopila globiformis]PPQ30846.1 hypothetical protein CCS01_18445 [Rhodopila globiformis]
MKSIFSTKDLHPRDRFDRWHDVACRTIIRHDSSPEDRFTFRAELQTGAFDEVGLVLFENTPRRYLHTVGHAALPGTDDLLIWQLLTGAASVEQSNGEVALTGGDVVLIDPRLPYSGRFSSASRSLVLKVPRHALEARLGKTSGMSGRLLNWLQTENSLMSAILGMLPIYEGTLNPRAEMLVKDHALDLVAISLAGVMDQRPRVSSARSLACVNVRIVIEARLADPALDSEAVAAAAGFSVRYVNAALAGEGTSIRRLIQKRRLERCRKALEDPSQAHRTVSEIAYGWGFSDMTHFGRSFRAAYAILPSEYRHANQSDRVRSAPHNGRRKPGSVP